MINTLSSYSIKATNLQNGEFESYLSTFNTIDTQKDIVAKTAFTTTLQAAYKRRNETGNKFLYVILYQHNPNCPIGGILSATVDEKGLLVKGYIDTEMTQGAAVWSGIKKGYLRSMSIGYQTVKAHNLNGVRVIDELMLFEASIVTFPANVDANILADSVKSYHYNGETRQEVYTVEIKASKKYTVEEVADLLSIDPQLARNIIEWAIKSHEITAYPAGCGYYVDGSDVASLSRLYADDIKANRASNGHNVHKYLELSYPEYAEKNAFLINNLREARKDDLRMDREVDETEYTSHLAYK